MINGSNYRRCQVRFHSIIWINFILKINHNADNLVYTDLFQRQMLVMNDLWTSSLQERTRTIEKTDDTNTAKINLHGGSKF